MTQVGKASPLSLYVLLTLDILQTNVTSVLNPELQLLLNLMKKAFLQPPLIHCA